MTREEIQAAVFEAISLIQEKSGRPQPELDENVRPQCDLPEFDSLRYTEVELLLAERLPRDVDLHKLLRSGGGLAEATLGELVTRLHNELDNDA